MGTASLQESVNSIVAQATSDILEAVREAVAGVALSAVGEPGRPRRAKRTILCPVLGCGTPGGGPKWGWFCAQHKDLPAAEKDKARLATMGARAVARRPFAKKHRSAA